MFRLGQYLEQPTFPARLGYEAAGTVEAVGPGVRGLKPGDAVSTVPAFSQNQYGVYGDVAIVPAAAVAKHPPSLSWTGIAAIQIAGMVGATPIALTRKHDKRAALTKLGAAHVIAKYGARKCEANALIVRPQEADRIIRSALSRYIGDDELEDWRQALSESRQRISDLVGGIRL